MVDLVVALAESDCEQLRAGWLAQPANAVSSLAYLGVGGWLLWRARPAGGHRLTLVGGGAAIAAVGLGSFSYHGPQPGWAGAAHDASIAVLIAVLVAGGGGILARRGAWRLAVPAWGVAAAWMALAVPAHLLGRSGAALCHPAAPWQPHAAWHLLSATALGFVVVGLSRRGVPSYPPSPDLTTGVTAQRTSRVPSMPAARWPGREQ